MKLEFGRKIYSIRESNWIFYHGLRTVRAMMRARKNGELSRQFAERLMLAVTEVNGCSLCAWGHTRAALESGMSGEEIRQLLRGETEHLPADEIPAILFAQHYADTRGHPTQVAWERVVADYGPSKAGGILGAVRMIMIGNAFGIAGGALLSRLRGRPDPRSGVVYEAGMVFAAVAYFPVALAHSAITGLSREPLISF